MFAAVAAIFMLISSGTSKTADYFKYSDCDFECSSRNISCVITEINPSYFPCECLVNADQCVSLAADDQVCLQPGASALGGSKIWPDFQRHKNETTTTTTHTSTTNSDVTTTTTHMTTTNSDVTTATPPHTDRDNPFIYLTVILAVTNALCLAAIGFLLRRLRQNSTPSYSHIPSNEVYQETVQDIEDI